MTSVATEQQGRLRRPFFDTMNDLLVRSGGVPLDAPKWEVDEAGESCAMAVAQPFLDHFNSLEDFSFYRPFVSRAKFDYPLPTFVGRSGVVGTYHALFEGYSWVFVGAKFEWSFSSQLDSVHLSIVWPTDFGPWTKFFEISLQTAPELVGNSGDATVNFIMVEGAKARVEVILPSNDQTDTLVSNPTSQSVDIGEVSAALAHAINNPMAVISSNIDYVLSLLEERGIDEAQGALLDALASVSRVERFVVAFQALADGVEDSGLGQANLGAVVQEVVSAGEREFARGITIQTQIERLPLIVCVGSVNHALHAVLKNATQAAADAGIDQVLVRTFRDREFGVVEVVDGGRGFADGDISRARQAFFSTRPPGEGAGLGLTLADRVARASGGRLEIVTGPSRTTVRLAFPLAQLPNDQDEEDREE